MLHLRWHTWEKTLTKHSSAQSFCTGSDDPAEQCWTVLRKSGWSGLSPDDPDLDICERLVVPGRMIRPYTGWSEPGSSSLFLAYFVPTLDDPRLLRMIREPPENTQRSLSEVGVYIPLHPPSFTSLSLSDQPRLQSIHSFTSLHPRAWFLQGNT